MTPAKTIVAHVSVDLDAISSAWLLKKFRPGWREAQLKFVPAGGTLDDKPADSNPDIAHVDTGLGMFDHHQIEDRNLCAAKRVFDFLVNKKHIKSHDLEPLSRMVDFIVQIDNFKELFFPNPTSDIYDFSLHQVIEGLKGVITTDQERCELGFKLLDGVLQIFKNKLRAEEEIARGLIFDSHWGKSLGIETRNEEALRFALLSGYDLVARKDPERGNVRIKSKPDEKLDLTPLYNKLRQADPKATWFLHISKNMLLNGSSKNPNAVASSLSLQKVIEIIKEI